MRVSVICYFIFEPPCSSPRLAFATHSRSMSDCLDRPVQQPSQRPPLLPRLPREAGQLSSRSSARRLGVPSIGRQAPPIALQRRVQLAATARLQLRSTCRPYLYAPVHSGPPQPLAQDPRPARQAPLVPPRLVRQGQPSPPQRLQAGRRRRQWLRSRGAGSTLPPFAQYESAMGDGAGHAPSGS